MRLAFIILSALIVLWCIWDASRHWGLGWEQVPAVVTANALPDYYNERGQGGSLYLRPWLSHRLSTDDSATQRNSLPSTDQLSLGEMTHLQQQWPLAQQVMVWRHPQLAPYGQIIGPPFTTAIIWRVGMVIWLLFLLFCLVRSKASRQQDQAPAILPFIACTMLGIGLLLSLALSPLWRLTEVSTWVQVDGAVEAIREGSYHSKRGEMWKGEVVYTYSYEGQDFRNNAVDHDWLGSPQWQADIAALKAGESISVLVNPAQPWRSVLKNRLHEPWFLLARAILALPFLAIGFALLRITFAKKSTLVQ